MNRIVMWLGIAAVASVVCAQPSVPTTPAWVVEGSGNENQSIVAPAGDVNGDGFDDLLVGWSIGAHGGQVRLFLGSLAGPSRDPAWSFEARFETGGQIASAGDVNGDGFDDVVVGIPFDDGQRGQVALFTGSASGLSSVPAWSVVGEQADSYFGYEVASAGDVDHDGYADVLVAARLYGNGQPREGKVYLYPGSAAGPALAPSWTREGDRSQLYLGKIAPAGDVNGDGFADVLVGASYVETGALESGHVWLYLGSASGLAATAAWRADGDPALYSSIGSAFASAGDVNGDGYADVLVRDSFYLVEHAETRDDLYLGGGSGLAAAPAWSTDWNHEPFGNIESIAAAGDVNADGYDDVILARPEWSGDDPSAQKGEAVLFLGSASGLALLPAWRIQGTQESQALGVMVAPAGDVDGDGIDGFAVSEFFSGPGRISLYQASCSPAAAPSAYGTLLFAPRCLASAPIASDRFASAFAARRRAGERFFLSSVGDAFEPLAVEDALSIDGADAGLGPYSTQPGVPPLRFGHPIEESYFPEVAPEVTALIPSGPGTVRFDLRTLQGNGVGNTAIYLVQDCGVFVADGAPGASSLPIRWVSRDQAAGSQPDFDVRFGRLSELRADGGFARAQCAGRFHDNPAQLSLPDPFSGDAVYFLLRGISSCAASGYGNSSLEPDPRNTLDSLAACP